MLDVTIHKFVEWNGAEVFILREDLLPFAFGGNKVRIALKLIEDAKSKCADTIVGYGNSRSNLCRVLAMLCTKNRMRCVIISPSDDDGARVKTINERIVERFGAEIVRCQKSAAISDVVQSELDGLSAKGYRPYYIFGNKFGKGNEKVLMSAYEEVAGQILRWQGCHDVVFDKIALAVGTGSTYAGLVRGLRCNGNSTAILGFTIARDKLRCEAEIARFMSCDGLCSENDIVISDIALAGGYGKTSEDELAFIGDVTNRSSILFDSTYAGKALWGLKSWCDGSIEAKRTILFIHTGSLPLVIDEVI